MVENEAYVNRDEIGRSLKMGLVMRIKRKSLPKYCLMCTLAGQLYIYLLFGQPFLALTFETYYDS